MFSTYFGFSGICRLSTNYKLCDFSCVVCVPEHLHKLSNMLKSILLLWRFAGRSSPFLRRRERKSRTLRLLTVFRFFTRPSESSTCVLTVLMSCRNLYDHIFSTLKWAWEDSNLRPSDYESPALTAELQALTSSNSSNSDHFSKHTFDAGIDFQDIRHQFMTN